MSRYFKNQLVKKTKQEKLTENATIGIPAMMLPGFRASLAAERNVSKNILIHAWGGLGDQICAEPAIRFACDRFKDCKISVISEFPELFRHLPLENLFDVEHPPEKPEEYYVFYTVYPHGHLQWEFMTHLHIHCVDYSSLCMWRIMLPDECKTIGLRPPSSDVNGMDFKDCVAVHAGKHWQSNTFPKSWWDAVIKRIIDRGYKPLLVRTRGQERGTVDVDPTGCLDFRDHLSIVDSINLLQKVKVLLTNDSDPLHMAASGNAWIGFVSLIKHPDFLYHYRNGLKGYKMQHFGKGNIFNELNLCPNNADITTVEDIGDKVELWLPDPIEFADWGCDRMDV